MNALGGKQKAGQIIREYRTDRCRTERLRIIGKQVRFLRELVTVSGWP